MTRLASRGPVAASRGASVLTLGMLALISGCGDDGPGGPVDGGDAGPDAGPPRLLVGTGETEFVALDDGDEVELFRGDQAGGGREGGFHVFVGIRLTGVRRDDVALMSIDVLDGDGGVQASTTLLPRRLVGADGVDMVAVGINPILADCCAVADGPATFDVEITPSEGAALPTLDGSVEVTVGSCIGATGDLCE